MMLPRWLTPWWDAAVQIANRRAAVTGVRQQVRSVTTTDGWRCWEVRTIEEAAS